jgi:competence ComEA-like helix-hairpin-helix protein
MQNFNSFIYNNYGFVFKLLPLIFLLLMLNCSQVQQSQQLNTEKQVLVEAIDINSATFGQLESLPKIGKGLAQNIIEHREKYGKFRKVEHLILVKKMSDKKFREIQNLIKAE